MTIPVRVDPAIAPHVVRSGLVLEPEHIQHVLAESVPADDLPLAERPVYVASYDLMRSALGPYWRGWFFIELLADDPNRARVAFRILTKDEALRREDGGTP